MLPEAWVAGVLLGDVATMDETDYQCGLLQKKKNTFSNNRFYLGGTSPTTDRAPITFRLFSKTGRQVV